MCHIFLSSVYSSPNLLKLSDLQPHSQGFLKHTSVPLTILKANPKFLLKFGSNKCDNFL